MQKLQNSQLTTEERNLDLKAITLLLIKTGTPVKEEEQSFQNMQAQRPTNAAGVITIITNPGHLRIKNMGCFSRVPGFNSQHAQGSSLISGDGIFTS